MDYEEFKYISHKSTSKYKDGHVCEACMARIKQGGSIVIFEDNLRVGKYYTHLRCALDFQRSDTVCDRCKEHQLPTELLVVGDNKICIDCLNPEKFDAL